MFKDRRKFIHSWQENSPILFSASGMICSILVVLEMFEKLFNDSAKNWSPIRLFGPQVWIPVVTDKGRLVAVHMMIYGFIYFLACGKLLKAQKGRSIALAVPWYVMHSIIALYQFILLVLNIELYGMADIVVAICFFVVNVLTLVSLCFTMRRWHHHPEKKESWHGSDFEDYDYDFDKPSIGGGSQSYVVRAMTRMRSHVMAKPQPQPQPEPETELEEIGD